METENVTLLLSSFILEMHKNGATEILFCFNKTRAPDRSRCLLTQVGEGFGVELLNQRRVEGGEDEEELSFVVSEHGVTITRRSIQFEGDEIQGGGFKLTEMRVTRNVYILAHDFDGTETGRTQVGNLNNFLFTERNVGIREAANFDEARRRIIDRSKEGVRSGFVDVSAENSANTSVRECEHGILNRHDGPVAEEDADEFVGSCDARQVVTSDNRRDVVLDASPRV